MGNVIKSCCCASIEVDQVVVATATNQAITHEDKHEQTGSQYTKYEMGGDPELEAATTSGPSEDFSLIGQQFIAKVVSVYDGDTLRVKFRTSPGAPIVQMVARMSGYDSPEIKPPIGAVHRELHTRAAKVARDKLKEHVNGQMVRLTVVKPHSGTREKFGRLLVSMQLVRPERKSSDVGHATSTTVNEWMVQERFGKAYNGGTKVEFSQSELQVMVDKAMYN
jgi:endonuclease YncB( thermonuclease family)